MTERSAAPGSRAQMCRGIAELTHSGDPLAPIVPVSLVPSPFANERLAMVNGLHTQTQIDRYSFFPFTSNFHKAFPLRADPFEFHPGLGDSAGIPRRVGFSPTYSVADSKLLCAKAKLCAFYHPRSGIFTSLVGCFASFNIWFDITTLYILSSDVFLTGR